MSQQSDAAPTPPRGQIQRVRHETRRRLLTVARVEDVSPVMRRVHFQSPELKDFVSASPDDHIKLIFGEVDGAPVMRDYTPRRFDNAGETLAVDFALHDDAGPATAWAMAVKAGDTLQIGGPRGSAIIPDVFDWYLMIGDETALPAIGRRVEELRADVPVITIGLVPADQDVQSFETAAKWDGTWIRRDVDGADDVANACRAIDRLMPTTGEGFVWLAGEAQFAKSLRAYIIEQRGHPAVRMKAAGYWVKGGEGTHQPLD
jgi:NADPH-dependent ferric siderophore reductase